LTLKTKFLYDITKAARCRAGKSNAAYLCQARITRLQYIYLVVEEDAAAGRCVSTIAEAAKARTIVASTHLSTQTTKERHDLLVAVLCARVLQKKVHYASHYVNITG
jgi:hypothetical protein